jgi:hypothetical protein
MFIGFMILAVALMAVLALPKLYADFALVTVDSDVTLFKTRYERRGLKVLQVERVGTSHVFEASFLRKRPIRKYKVVLRHLDGSLETRIRGVAPNELNRDRIWRFDGEGRPELLS